MFKDAKDYDIKPKRFSPNRGNKYSPETIAKMKIGQAAHRAKKLADPNYVHPNKGKKPSRETIAKMLATTAKTVTDPNYVHPGKGKKPSPETLAKIQATKAVNKKVCVKLFETPYGVMTLIDAMKVSGLREQQIRGRVARKTNGWSTTDQYIRSRHKGPNNNR